MKAPAQQGIQLFIRGIVQGVGFRPAVWRIANALGLSGSVQNDGHGVNIQIWGLPDQLDQFKQSLYQEKPPAAVIQSINQSPLDTRPASGGFQILESLQQTVSTGILPDQAICPECRREILDSASRHHAYPFTSCAQCGPRFSILKQLPYDRRNTSMSAFTCCDECHREYQAPTDRRFHAQPIACPACGPEITLVDASGKKLIGRKAIDTAVNQIRQGKILALKGIGGFHFCCDASNHEAVTELRRRKQRPAKPFALIASDIEMVKRFAHVSPHERSLLEDPAAPIVLLRRKPAPPLSPEIAPQIKTLGFILAYTPLHVLLMQHFDTPLVLTSANPSGSQICSDNNEALENLSHIADDWLIHNRDIIHAVEDSVVRSFQNQLSVIRLARGLAPTYQTLPEGFTTSRTVLSMGSELKNTIGLVSSDRAVISPQIGDLSHPDIFRHYQKEVDQLTRLLELSPDFYVADIHPGYHSTQLGEKLALQHQKPLIKVQHHHAHLAACLAENQIPRTTRPVLGIVMDGMGIGENGKEIWGGEFLLADYSQATRIGRITPICLPGGEKAMHEPWRNCWAHLNHFFDWHGLNKKFPHLSLLARLNRKPVALLEQMQQQQVNSPSASSCGRLFDAVAAALGICFDRIRYEGQAAIELEELATEIDAPDQYLPYPVELLKGKLLQIDWQPLWNALLFDLFYQTPKPVIAYRFHSGLAEAFAKTATHLSKTHDLSTVALGGGVFQNSLLLGLTIQALERQQLNVLTCKQFPFNDAGLSLGQAMVALAQIHSSDP